VTCNWKIPAVAGGGAFLLSLLVGVAGRIAFGVLATRALIWALIFAALAFGIDWLLRRYLPELYSGSADSPEEGERTVDITLEEENPVAGSQETLDAAETAEVTEDDDEVSAGETEAEELETLGEAGENAKADIESSGNDEEEDDLPEGDLADFGAAGSEFSGAKSEEETPRQQAESVDVLGMDEDPATVARAVRTFMNKDQEG
jgi:hypothetical protein